jgi:hypothetical protein
LPGEAVAFAIVCLPMAREALVNHVMNHCEAQGNAAGILRNMVRQGKLADLGMRRLSGEAMEIPDNQADDTTC